MTLLYGVPGAETLHLDPVRCYEVNIAPWLDHMDRSPRDIEVWTTRDNRDHLPDAEDVAIWLRLAPDDHGAEIDEEWGDQLDEALRDPGTVALIQALLDRVASMIPRRMADRHIRTLRVTWHPSGYAMIDGATLDAWRRWISTEPPEHPPSPGSPTRGVVP